MHFDTPSYQNEEVVILNYCDGTGDDGTEVEIYLNNGKVLVFSMFDLASKLNRFRPKRTTLIFVLRSMTSYYKVVVIKVPLQGQNATIDKVLWIGLNLLPQDGFGKAPTTALCF